MERTFDNFVDKGIPQNDQYFYTQINEDTTEDEGFNAEVKTEVTYWDIGDQDVEVKEVFEEGGDKMDTVCDECGDQICTTVNCATVQAELRKFLQQQEVGLDTTFRCIRCRDCKQCLKGAGEERKSMTQEAHQEIIRQSVSIDKVGRKATAKLPFVID